MLELESDAEESVEQLAKAWNMFVRDYGLRRGPVDAYNAPFAAIRWASSQFRFWNCITLLEGISTQALLEERLAWAADFMRDRGQPGLLWVFEDLLPAELRSALPELAQRHGLAFAFDIAGMAGDILPIAERAQPGLEFVRVENEEQLTAYADINSRAYGFPLREGRDGLCGSILWKSGMHAYLALEDKVPVAAAAAVAVDGRLFIALVATVPEKQRLGYGEAATRKALYEGAKASGLRRTILHATTAGAPVYERIGYRKVATIRAFSLAP